MRKRVKKVLAALAGLTALALGGAAVSAAQDRTPAPPPAVHKSAPAPDKETGDGGRKGERSDPSDKGERGGSDSGAKEENEGSDPSDKGEKEGSDSGDQGEKGDGPDGK